MKHYIVIRRNKKYPLTKDIELHTLNADTAQNFINEQTQEQNFVRQNINKAIKCGFDVDRILNNYYSIEEVNN